MNGLDYICDSCGQSSKKWSGQCGFCGAWNSLSENKKMLLQTKNTVSKTIGQKHLAGKLESLTSINQIKTERRTRMDTGFSELNRILGDGIMPGAVILIGGDPGIGKSTLLLQLLSYLSQNYLSIYTTGEESLEQIKSRSDRVGLTNFAKNLKLLAENNLETIIHILETEKPKIVVIDSIQTLFSLNSNSSAGSVSQLKECTSEIVQFAKKTGTTVFIAGHVTKDGSLAGPRILEHIVDTVLYFEGDKSSRYRILRAFKNRFGAVNEIGVFAMTETGLKQVSNPSAIFLSSDRTQNSGCIITAMNEGTRPLLLEIQALVSPSQYQPRRICVGIDSQRLNMLLAVLNKHSKIDTQNMDVFVNVVGGIKATETAMDLAVIIAIYSSIKEIVLPVKLLVFGEVGLTGEIRPVSNGEMRLSESAKHGFEIAIIPKRNKPTKSCPFKNTILVENLADALLELNKLNNQ